MSDETVQIALAAQLLSEGYEPDEITLLAMTHRRVVDLVNESVQFHLIADNVDRPDADKYGTHADGTPRYAPEWYMAQAVKTAIHEGLYGALRDVLRCPSVSDMGNRCTGSVLHTTCHWDGNGDNWEAPRD